jgi:hypothetical protein
MRCFIGFALFLVLFFGSCATLKAVTTKTSGPLAAAEVLRKYHAAVAVGAGAATLLLCSLPTLLSRPRYPEEWYGA